MLRTITNNILMRFRLRRILIDLHFCVLIFRSNDSARKREKPKKLNLFFQKQEFFIDIKTQNVYERKNRARKKQKKKKNLHANAKLGENARNSLKNKRFILFLYRKAIKKQFATECVFTFEIFSTFCL